MKSMKNGAKQLVIGAMVGVGLCISANCALAATISTDDYGIGTIVPGTPASPADELGYVQTAVSMWNGATAPGTYNGNTYSLLSGGKVPTPLTAPTLLPSNDQNFNGSGNTATISLGNGGYEYLLTRWGGGDILWYVEGLSGNVTVENDLVSPGAVNTGLSHFALFGDENNPPPTVPDGGSTAAMLGSVLVVMGTFGRKFLRI
jgi:hypothetical protein